MFRRVAVGLVASAATLLTGVPAHAALGGPPARSTQPNATSVRAAHPLPAHRHHEAVKRTPATAGTNNSKRDGGNAATAAPATSIATAAGSAAHPVASWVAGSHALDSLAARAPPARQ